MGYWLAKSGDAQQCAFIKRFDPRYWSVNFPRPMMAAVTTTGPHSLRADCVFYKENDLCGLIWEAEDRFDHPLLAYETARDFRGCTLSFDWAAQGIKPLDAISGPTLTIEGRDANGASKSWFVRLFNYAVGNRITLDFDALQGGFTLPLETDPVWAGDIDRMFIALVPSAYTGADVPLAGAAEAWVTLSNIVCDGPSSVLEIGDVLVPPHGLSIATGYDDSYNLTPERLLRNAFHLGYRGSINHYVGMSHYFRLEPSGGGLYASLTGGALNIACAKWHADFAARAKAYGYSLITSLSYELFNENCWNDWKQRTNAGDPALTGWVPPSTLLSPANPNANTYLQSVARAFVQIAVTAGHAPRFQIGEPWWWVTADGRPCLYDDAAKAALGGNPVNIANVRSTTLSANKKALLDAAGVILATSTIALANAVKLDHPTCETMILVYLPTVLDAAAPDLQRANVPLGWAAPAFDVLQLEDYDWVTTGNTGASARGATAMQTRLSYAVADQHYLSGFVLNPSEGAQWRLIDAAAEVARKRGVAETFIWALPQVQRDGYTHFSEGDAEVQAFDDVIFPLALGRGAQVSPGFSTAIVTTASGHEQRNAAWASGRLRFDAGPGIRSEDDLKTLIAFFRARRGAAKGFRFRDPLDHDAVDQLLGTGDGVKTSFPLVKRYGTGDDAELRRITRPVAGTLSVTANNALMPNGWTVAGGTVSFTVPPASGVTIRASFQFDVPVRFAEDSLEIDAVTFAAGDAASVPIIEVREA
jgi:uncharacterized protein (TIGR02217 family)